MFKVNKKYAKSNIPVTIRFTDDLYTKLKEIAKQEDISFNGLVLQCCGYAVENYSEEKKESES